MIRFVSFLLFLAIARSASAQAVADPLESLRQVADKASADWQGLAKGLEQKIATLLPCDPKSRAAGEEVSRASDARLAALSAYKRAPPPKGRGKPKGPRGFPPAKAALPGGGMREPPGAVQERPAIEAK